MQWGEDAAREYNARLAVVGAINARAAGISRRETKVAARAMEREARRGRQGQKTRAIGRREAESSASIGAIGARETKVAASAME